MAARNWDIEGLEACLVEDLAWALVVPACVVEDHEDVVAYQVVEGCK